MTSTVTMIVFDLHGRKAAALSEAVEDAGVHEVALNRSELGSGIYLGRMNVVSFAATQKVVLLQ